MYGQSDSVPTLKGSVGYAIALPTLRSLIFENFTALFLGRERFWRYKPVNMAAACANSAVGNVVPFFQV
jgi:hypothetical protein